MIDCTDREQIRIGRELHDSLGQEWTALSYLVQTVRNAASKGRARSDDFEEIQTRIRETLEHSRSLARKLCPDVPPSGLVPAFEDMAGHFRDLFGIRCVFENRIKEPVKDGTVSFNLCRIAQEAVLNAVRHGKAGRVYIRLETGERNLLSILDDGSGIVAPECLDRSNGMGLAMMQYRAGVIGGGIVIRERKPHGVVLECSFRNSLLDTEGLEQSKAESAGSCAACEAGGSACGV